MTDKRREAMTIYDEDYLIKREADRKLRVRERLERSRTKYKDPALKDAPSWIFKTRP